MFRDPCGPCLSRGWVLMAKHMGNGEWREHKGLCPSCSGLSVENVEALLAQAKAENWFRIRYNGTNARCWDEYDWGRNAWADEVRAEKRPA